MNDKWHGNGLWSRCFTSLIAVAAIAGCQSVDDLAVDTASQPLTGSGGVADPNIDCGSGTDVTVEVSGTNIVDANPSDTVFIIDRSGSIGAAAFVQDKEFMTSLVTNLPVDDDHRIAIVAFSDAAQPITGFTGDRTSLLATIGALTYPGGATCTSCGLDLADDTFNTTGAAGARRIGIVITDGMANVNVASLQGSIDQIKADGVELFAVGVGPGITLTELNRLASDPDATHVFSAASFDTLETILGDLVSAVTHPEATNATLVLNINPDFAVSSPSASGGAIAQAGNQLTWDIDAIQDATFQLGFHIQDTSTSPAGTRSVIDSYAYVDDEGNGLTLPTIEVDVGVCDRDGDGVPDTSDQCPDTLPLAIIGATGCSIDQLCPCAGPWQNHGKYVSCVAHEANALLASGVIDQATKGAIVSAAAQSSCGK